MRAGTALLAWWRLSRPETWMVSVLPFYVGFVLAARTIVPHPGLAAQALQDMAALHLADAAVAAWRWAAASWRLLLGAMALGPLIWTATLLINDVHDLAGDRLNPRKARSPLVQGIVSRGWANATAHLFALLTLVASLPLGWGFTACVLLNLALAWAYSVPPVRLKTRPGADLLVNAIGVGAVSGVAGWAVAGDLADAPWPFLPQGLLVAAAIYVPTTLVDHDADAKAGYQTLATHLGPRGAYLVGWWCWVACNLGALALCLTGQIIPRTMLPLLAIFVPLLLFEYHAFIGKARDGPEMVKGIILCSLTFLAVNLVFALMYTGLWAPA